METQKLHNQPRLLQALWAFGSNGNGQLGVGHDRDSVIPSLARMAHHGQTHHSPNVHWHINDPVDFAASGGNHTALISCPNRKLWMAGSDDNHQCLRSAELNTGAVQCSITTTASAQVSPPAATAQATPSTTTAEEEETKAQLLQFHQVADLPFLQALDRQRIANNSLREVNSGLGDSSAPRSIRWCSVACGWAFTIGVAQVEDDSASNKVLSEDSCILQNHNHPFDHVQDMEKVVFVWGAGSFGELGLRPGITKTGNRPERLLTGCLAHTLQSEPLSLRYDVFKVKAGLRHVLALARDREQNGKVVLVGWGNNRYGQLGMPLEPMATMIQNTKKKSSGPSDSRSKLAEPTLLYMAPLDASSAQYKPGVEIVDVACGQNHSLVVLSDGTVYSSGLNKHGQLGPSYVNNDCDGNSYSNSAIHTPKTLPFRVGFQQVIGLPSVNRISCGWSHNVATNSNSSEIYLWGRCDRGQLGHSTPLLQAPAQTDISEDSSPPVWSTLRHLRIMLDDSDSGGPEIIRSLSCGSEHTLALAESGKIYAWGWNEHGNCGTASTSPNTGNSELPEATEIEDRLDVLSPRIVFVPSATSTAQRAHGQVMGGYGTSWILLSE